MTAKFEPTDPTISPRFAELATFMRAKFLKPAEADGAHIAIAGVPFDLGTFYRAGARQGPAAIREASRALKSYSASGISPFRAARICDVGDVPVNPMSLEVSLSAITDLVRDLTNRSIRPVVLGGDHTVTLPVLRGLVTYPVGIVYFDAHPDTADAVWGTKINHGTTLRRAIEEELVDPKRAIQIGLRGQMNTRDDYAWARGVGVRVITMDEYEEIGRSATIEEIRRVVRDEPVYVSFDIDALDASQAPGTGVPEPGGLTMRDALTMIRELRGLPLIGCDVCEVSPSLDPTAITAVNAAHLVCGLLCVMAEQVTLEQLPTV